MKRWQVIGSALFLSVVVNLSLSAVVPRQEPCGDYWAPVLLHRDSGTPAAMTWGTIEDYARGGRHQFGDASEQYQLGMDMRFWPDSVEAVFYDVPGGIEIDRHLLVKGRGRCVYAEELDDMPGFTLLFLPVSPEQTARWPNMRVEVWR